MALVFQYGSNASSVRLNSAKRLDGAARAVGLVRTQDSFDLSFTHFSRCKCNQCATADLVRNGSRPIYGVLYEIPDNRIYRSCSAGLKTLDEIEGECSAYCRRPISVVMAAPPHDSHEAIIYLAKSPFAGLRTSAEYVAHIIRGLREHDAPDEYVSYVKERVLDNNPDLANELKEL